MYPQSRQLPSNGSSMRILVVSDIHGNIWALEEVLKKESYDIMICLGDLVDYGPYPNEVIELIREKAHYTVMGNHDYSLALNTDCPGTTEYYLKMTMDLREFFNYELKEENLAFIRSLELKKTIEINGTKWLLVHSSAQDPLGDYVTFNEDLEIIRSKMTPNEEGVRRVLYGHTHIQGSINLGEIEVINPGSLGFPRDNLRVPTYIIIEDNKVKFGNLNYDFEKLRKSFIEAKVPDNYIKTLLGV